ncbi:hypothetical protein EVAR_63024_1 [Eumeta japonica]|uniref:Uncharacterized protein n=1 Tax=Eumeta variegata TaxID=151549 RepID=A0A4C1YVR3_EUMVA|nr:hypothetical protein EVAR_63024_1 [Eumeta japonica]
MTNKPQSNESDWRLAVFFLFPPCRLWRQKIKHSNSGIKIPLEIALSVQVKALEPSVGRRALPADAAMDQDTLNPKFRPARGCRVADLPGLVRQFSTQPDQNSGFVSQKRHT